MHSSCPEGQTCKTDENGNEYYVDKDGNKVYTTSIEEAVVVTATTAVGYVATKVPLAAKQGGKSFLGWVTWAGSKVWEGVEVTGRFVGNAGSVAVGSVAWILTNPTTMGPPPRTDGCPEQGCFPKVDIDKSANPNPDDNTPNTDPAASPTQSKGGKQNKLDTGLADYTDEEVTQKSKDKSLPKAERERFKTEDKARKNRNKAKRGNK